MPRRSNPWLPQSANEWIASASIEEEPVIQAAVALATKIPKLADSAYSTARMEPPVDIRTYLNMHRVMRCRQNGMDARRSASAVAGPTARTSNTADARFGGNPSGRGDLGAFRRRRPPCVRRVHGGVRRLELHPKSPPSHTRGMLR